MRKSKGFRMEQQKDNLIILDEHGLFEFGVEIYF